MNIFSIFFMNLTWVLLPLMIFLIYEAYSENINNQKNNIILDFSLITSLYLIMRFGSSANRNILQITFDGIIALMYIKKRNKGALLTSLIGIIYFKNEFTSELMILIKYIIFFIFSKKYENNNKYYQISTFSTSIIYLFTLILLNKINVNEIIDYLMCYIIAFSINILFTKAESIIRINICYKELMKEQQLRNSLFKISHEIKNPIAVCKGYLDMFNTNNIDHFKKYIPIIKSEINRTLDLLQDFSACNKINIERDIVDIGLILDEISKKFNLMFDNKNIDFQIEKIEDEIFINGDYNRLNQVLVNMIKNSIEAIDKNKKSYIKIYSEQKEKEIKIIIEDNGIGISKENMDKISEPFFTTKQNGTGLGVLLSKEIISAHDGTIEYESEENIGTKVIISLPTYEY